MAGHGQLGIRFLFLLALALTAGSFLAEAWIGISLGDEGYLWEGVLKTMQGQVPIRDFASYDPGRYYWCAFCMMFLGKSIIALRLSNAVFQFAGLLCGLLAAARVIKSAPGMLLTAATLVLWMVPRWKVYECSVEMMAVYVAVLLVENPTARRHLWAGIFAGLTTFLGRNHGLYCCLGFSTLTIFLGFRSPTQQLVRSLAYYLMGVSIGFGPYIAFLVLVPGFREAYIEFLSAMFRSGHTNFPLPIPWPWKLGSPTLSLVDKVCRFCIGLGFLGLVILPVCLAVTCLRLRASDLPARALLIAATFIGVFYLHHAFARADINHLAQAIHPCLLGGVALAAYTRRSSLFSRYTLASAVLVVSLFATVSLHPLSSFLAAKLQRQEWVVRDVAGVDLLLPHEEAVYLDSVHAICAGKLEPGDSVFLAPFYAGVYPILGKVSPIWNAYPIGPECIAYQKKMVLDLRNHPPRIAIVSDAGLDGHGERCFRNDHALVWDYLVHELQERPEIQGLSGFHVFEKTGN